MEAAGVSDGSSLEQLMERFVVARTRQTFLDNYTLLDRDWLTMKESDDLLNTKRDAYKSSAAGVSGAIELLTKATDKVKTTAITDDVRKQIDEVRQISATLAEYDHFVDTIKKHLPPDGEFDLEEVDEMAKNIKSLEDQLSSAKRRSVDESRTQDALQAEIGRLSLSISAYEAAVRDDRLARDVAQVQTLFNVDWDDETCTLRWIDDRGGRLATLTVVDRRRYPGVASVVVTNNTADTPQQAHKWQQLVDKYNPRTIKQFLVALQQL